MNKYITKAELRVDPFNISHEKVDDKYLEILQELTYNLVNLFCIQTFELEGTEEAPIEIKVDGQGRDTVFLPKRLITLKEVRDYYDVENYDPYEPRSFIVKPKYVVWNNLEDNSYTYPRVIGSRHYDGCYQFAKGVANIGIVGIWGWPAYPNPIKYLQGRLIEKIIMDKSFAQKFASESIGDYSYSLRGASADEEITGDFELDTIIKQYRSWLNYATV